MTYKQIYYSWLFFVCLGLGLIFAFTSWYALLAWTLCDMTCAALVSLEKSERL
jgi:hypothetical protein